MLSHGIMNWLPELLVTHGMGLTQAGYWAAIPTLVGIVGALTIPRLATPPRRFAILIALCFLVLLAAVLLQFAQRPLLLGGLVMQGIARATLVTVLILTLVELPGVGDRHAGTAAGLFFSAAELGGVLGPVTLGVLYDLTHGFGTGLTLFSMIAVLLILGARRLRDMSARRGLMSSGCGRWAPPGFRGNFFQTVLIRVQGTHHSGRRLPTCAGSYRRKRFF